MYVIVCLNKEKMEDRRETAEEDWGFKSNRVDTFSMLSRASHWLYGHT